MTGLAGIVSSDCVWGDAGDGGMSGVSVLGGGVHGDGTSGLFGVFGVGWLEESGERSKSLSSSISRSNSTSFRLFLLA
jgi:hypothetical protein